MFFQYTNTINQIVSNPIVGQTVSLAGRVIAFRRQGGIAFGKLYDASNKIQFSFQKKLIGDLIKNWSDQIKLGVHIGITGEVYYSSANELTIQVNEFTLLQDVWKSFPDKHLGITSSENKLRKRYLDCIFDDSVRNTFIERSKIISFIRNALIQDNFLEFETPILTAQASGAQAKPFITHHNALDSDLYLRIAPETYLKRVVAAGFNKVFEIGKQFRNEGISPSHLQEFTSLEWYAAYYDYVDNLHMFHNKILNPLYTQYIKPLEIVKINYRDLFLKETGVLPDTMSAKEADLIFKTKIRPFIIEPTYVMDYPAHMSPMAARKTDDSNTVEQWQLIINGMEIVKCYTELTDPVLQKQLLLQQLELKNSGDDETMELEEDFIDAMEYGMPPMSGLGFGVDRLIAILLNKESLKDVVMFPTLLNK